MTNPPRAIELEESDTKGRYVMHGPNGAEAEMTFTKVGAHQVIIDHTEVPDVFRGQGVGLALVSRAVEDFREGHPRPLGRADCAKTPLLTSDSRFEERPAVAGTLESDNLGVRRHVLQIAQAQTQCAIDEASDLEPPS